ncbi:hypothetical protein JQ629_22830 [Bradyrhizobium sp. AUGA SZCCT0222]|uniref:hypothetical protein n=1 Tax=Bradyrhizobium sp. AUGA SZCCT0222 TaxID=2807668 RepID=UPI001BAAE32B|nr:hypothetical protein [Bradyrhizobium sp. AUGA SZCCT0222]MBR1270314.1 hypothetical protein [Bradyrhizobium sp. AUGA SZCCT0222]
MGRSQALGIQRKCLEGNRLVSSGSIGFPIDDFLGLSRGCYQDILTALLPFEFNLLKQARLTILFQLSLMHVIE